MPFEIFSAGRQLLQAVYKLHLRALFVELHELNFYAVGIVGPALPVEVCALLGRIILGCSGFQHLLPGFLDIIHGDADMEEPEYVDFIPVTLENIGDYVGGEEAATE